MVTRDTTVFFFFETTGVAGGARVNMRPTPQQASQSTITLLPSTSPQAHPNHTYHPPPSSTPLPPAGYLVVHVRRSDVLRRLSVVPVPPLPSTGYLVLHVLRSDVGRRLDVVPVPPLSLGA